MNEKMNDLLEQVRRGAVRAGDAAADAAYGVGKMAGELLSVAKLNVRIMDQKAAVNLAMRQLGELLYATHTGDPTESEVLQAKLEEIDALKAEIAALEAQIRKEKGAQTCGVCGAAIRKDDAFCRKCGGKL
ncbi:MAG: zinc ribbon domain-containing protein [Ruminococcaceae bacterium]|nr:zinc ribbon domain-containing protein [Oscillospiraceae bacterium]